MAEDAKRRGIGPRSALFISQVCPTDFPTLFAGSGLVHRRHRSIRWRTKRTQWCEQEVREGRKGSIEADGFNREWTQIDANAEEYERGIFCRG